MKAKVTLILWILALSAACTAEVNMDLVVNGARYQVPANPSAVGASLTRDGVLIVRYGDEQGRNYIAFEDVTQLEEVQYGCPAEEFYRRMFTEKTPGECDEETLAAFRHQFLEGASRKVWGESPWSVYLASAEGRFFAFRVDGGNVTKIESDFLSADDFERMLAPADSGVIKKAN